VEFEINFDMRVNVFLTISTNMSTKIFSFIDQ